MKLDYIESVTGISSLQQIASVIPFPCDEGIFICRWSISYFLLSVSIRRLAVLLFV